MDEQLTESTGWADFRSRSTIDDVDPWAWTEQRSAEPAELDLSHERVTAVLVTLDAEEWLPDTLAGLARLQPPPTRLIAIDNASTDSTRALLQRAHEHGVLDAVYDGERGSGFGAAVSAALAADRKRAPAERGSDRGTRWLWLLHDDAVPAPDALRALLSHAVTDPGLDVTGPKLLRPRRRRTAPRLSEIGTSISGTGRRELMLEPGEIDQGQRDQPQERLGVSTCGMLLKADVFTGSQGLRSGRADVP